jgi:hypothetical protein
VGQHLAVVDPLDAQLQSSSLGADAIE